jgi:hypothetical protein
VQHQENWRHSKCLISLSHTTNFEV